MCIHTYVYIYMFICIYMYIYIDLCTFRLKGGVKVCGSLLVVLGESTPPPPQSHKEKKWFYHWQWAEPGYESEGTTLGMYFKYVDHVDVDVCLFVCLFVCVLCVHVFFFNQLLHTAFSFLSFIVCLLVCLFVYLFVCLCVVCACFFLRPTPAYSIFFLEFYLLVRESACPKYPLTQPKTRIRALTH